MNSTTRSIVFFLSKFLGVYLLGNLLYGFWVESYSPKADPATHLVATQTVWVLDLFYEDMDYDYFDDVPKIWMGYGNRTVLNAYEGCNGINVFIIYLAFIFAYKGKWRPSLVYMVGGLLLLHLANIFRIVALFFVADRFPDYMYFTHKYLFTASIYGIVFILWFLWVKGVNKQQPVTKKE